MTPRKACLLPAMTPTGMRFQAQIEVMGPNLSDCWASALKICGLGGMSMNLGISESEAEGKPVRLELSERFR